MSLLPRCTPVANEELCINAMFYIDSIFVLQEGDGIVFHTEEIYIYVTCNIE